MTEKHMSEIDVILGNNPKIGLVMVALVIVNYVLYEMVIKWKLVSIIV